VMNPNPRERPKMKNVCQFFLLLLQQKKNKQRERGLDYVHGLALACGNGCRHMKMFGKKKKRKMRKRREEKAGEG
jgi:hypothetical protein